MNECSELMMIIFDEVFVVDLDDDISDDLFLFYIDDDDKFVLVVKSILEKVNFIDLGSGVGESNNNFEFVVYKVVELVKFLVLKFNESLLVE